MIPGHGTWCDKKDAALPRHGRRPAVQDQEMVASGKTLQDVEASDMLKHYAGQNQGEDAGSTKRFLDELYYESQGPAAGGGWPPRHAASGGRGCSGGDREEVVSHAELSTVETARCSTRAVGLFFVPQARHGHGRIFAIEA